MSAEDSGDREARALTLLIQLFGREAIDRLSLAGFADNEAIAQAGPERLAEEGGIPVSLARRIVAVAAEAQEDSAPPARPARRAPGRKAASGAWETGSAPPRPADGRSARSPDPFVDDAGLVSWMGFAAHRGARGGGLMVSVSDSILETPSPEPASSPAAHKPTAPENAAATGSSQKIARGPEGRQASPTHAIIQDSFWSFGTRTPAGPTSPSQAIGPDEKRMQAEGPGDQPPMKRPLPRRRTHHGH
ncbi:MAG TPA: hypothetical protein VFT43_15595 [Candidatus Polarisedimenticolia bacterium]|nr:hypothetical protein [Candidatus Polarisedimenticolia bacterium]